MNTFQKQTALRIAAVSVVLASMASSLAWYVSRENAEEGIVSLATEESGRRLQLYEAINLSGPNAKAHAEAAAQIIVGGLFDIAEIYDASGTKLAEALTSNGQHIETGVPSHGKPTYRKSSYENLKLPDGQWAMRVYVPLRMTGAALTAPITGYFEGVRLVPQWQSDQIMTSSLTAALMAGLAALLCGLAIFPVVVHLSRENERKTREVLDSHISMMEALGRAIAKRDSDTGAHNYRVSWIASGVGELMGLKGSAMQSLIAGSFLHDVGKIGIPDAILLKPGRLDAAELVTMRTHVAQGEEIVTGMGWLDGANAIVAAHHEKWDGSGYPRGLKGQEIPLAARIFAVADVFDALCSKRPYKEPLPLDAAMAILEKDTGSHFDPAVMAVFRGISGAVYQRLENATEDETRALLEARVLQHFE
jgi:HD-GYP domain-containing protein (c-di-GMP phosphodiesterase class II)